MYLESKGEDTKAPKFSAFDQLSPDSDDEKVSIWSGLHVPIETVMAHRACDGPEMR
jgi:hypothetical protein